MTAVVKSQLNPLANAFVPINRQNSSQNKTNIYDRTGIENETKTARKGSGEQKLSSLVPENEIKFKETALSMNPVLQHMTVFSGLTTMLNLFLKNCSFIGQNTSRMFASSSQPVISVCSEDYQEQTTSKRSLTETLKVTEEKIECSCPPMFGWIVPPDFTGNPFNFKYKCGKKYPHSPDSIEKCLSNPDMLDHTDAKISKLTLDECYSEIKDILTDVYETISIDRDTISKREEKCEVEDSLELSDSVSDNEESNESKLMNIDSMCKTNAEPELIDDGIHPLLQSTPAREEDGEFVEKVEKILERSLSSLPKSLDAVTFRPGAVCDPPCSVWCEFLPSAAKDTFKKYIKMLGNAKDCITTSQKSEHRHVFKRSLSAGDAPMYGQLNQTSALESREMLLLRRSDPLSYFRIHSSNPLINRNRHGSCDFLDRQLFTNSCVESNMWGKFDGVDSLWKPLPECMPVNGYNQKQNAKRGREAKQQRTEN